MDMQKTKPILGVTVKKRDFTNEKQTLKIVKE